MTGDPLYHAVTGLLRAVGVAKNSGDCRDYEAGKVAIMELDLPQPLYESAIRILTGWVNL